MRGLVLIGISAAHRAASGISEGDLVDVNLELDIEPRVVSVPPDLAKALDLELAVRAAFERMPFGLRRKNVALVEGAKTAEVRLRRIAKLLATLRAID